MRYTLAMLTLSFATILTGCGREEPAPGGKSPAMTTVAANYNLKEEPAGAREVIDVRAKAKNDDDVVVVGRIGGRTEGLWGEGKAQFTIVDRKLKPCNEREDDNCPTPWDYCCDLDQLPSASVFVMLVDDKGQQVASDARELLGVTELSTVVVRGKLERDKSGNVTVLARDVYVRKK